jgi:hypothetical protein
MKISTNIKTVKFTFWGRMGWVIRINGDYLSDRYGPSTYRTLNDAVVVAKHKGLIPDSIKTKDLIDNVEIEVTP